MLTRIGSKWKDDILLLAKYYAKIYADKYRKPVPEFDAACQDKLLQYSYPGNVRELQYSIERAMIMSEEEELHAGDIIFSPLESTNTMTEEAGNFKLSSMEKNTILKVIEKHNGNISKAAKELGITRTALYRRLSKYEI